MTASPADAPGATVRTIHPELIERYNDIHNAAYWRMITEQGDTPLDMLTVIREEAAGAPGSIGKLTLEQRATRSGWITALDELIEQADRERTGS